MTTTTLYAITTAMSSIDIIVMTLLKVAQTSPNLISPAFALPFSMALYAIDPLLFFKALNLQGIGIVNALWDTLSTVLIALIGTFVFGEDITGTQWIGILLCAAGIFLIG